MDQLDWAMESLKVGYALENAGWKRFVWHSRVFAGLVLGV